MLRAMALLVYLLSNIKLLVLCNIEEIGRIVLKSVS